MNPIDNYFNYRNALDSVIDVPCLPFFYLITVDISFIEQLPSFFSNTKINFEKLSCLANVFGQIQEHKFHLYTFSESVEIQCYISSQVIKNQAQLEQYYLYISSEEDEMQINMDILEDMKESFLIPDIYDQFHDFLSQNNNKEDMNCLECWQSLFVGYKKSQVRRQSQSIPLKQVAKKIYLAHLKEGAPKAIGIKLPHLEELEHNLDSPDPIDIALLDNLIEACYLKLYNCWRDFKSSE